VIKTIEINSLEEYERTPTTTIRVYELENSVKSAKLFDYFKKYTLCQVEIVCYFFAMDLTTMNVCFLLVIPRNQISEDV